MTSTRFYTDQDGDHSPTRPRNSADPIPKSSTIPRLPPNTGSNQEGKPTVQPQRLYEIHSPLLFDAFERRLVQDRVVYVDRDRGVILGVCREGEVRPLRGHGDRIVEVEKIEMEPGTVLLPGFVDVHVHCEWTVFFVFFLQRIDYSLPIFLGLLRTFALLV